jgi:hypothetical protein
MSGCPATYGSEPAVVARKPASWRKLRSETACVEPESVFSRARRAAHSATAFGPSVPH